MIPVNTRSEHCDIAREMVLFVNHLTSHVQQLTVIIPVELILVH